MAFRYTGETILFLDILNSNFEYKKNIIVESVISKMNITIYDLKLIETSIQSLNTDNKIKIKIKCHPSFF